jgi:hypothetical protein
MATFGMEETELGGSHRLNVAKAIEDGEGVAVFEHAGAVVR